jgi:sugar (pentulose or hexulose) kinase
MTLSRPTTCLQGCKDATQAAIAGLDAGARAQIKGLGVSGQQHGLVVLDAQKQV